MFNCPLLNYYYIEIEEEKYDIILKMEEIIELFEIFLKRNKFYDVSILLEEYNYKLDMKCVIEEYFEIYRKCLKEIPKEKLKKIHDIFVEADNEKIMNNVEDYITSIKCYIIKVLLEWYNKNECKYKLQERMIKNIDDEIKNKIYERSVNSEISLYQMCFKSNE